MNLRGLAVLVAILSVGGVALAETPTATVKPAPGRVGNVRT